MTEQRRLLLSLRLAGHRALRRVVFGFPFARGAGRARRPRRPRAALLYSRYSRYSRAYFQRWLLLGALIGVVAGVGAIIFYSAIALCTHLFLGLGAGFSPPNPVSEGATIIHPITRSWLLPVITTLGGLLTGIIVFTLAPEAEGHGTDAAIEAFHAKRGRIRARIPLIKMLASAITIGSGGSAGREGPTAQISAGFGSWLGDLLRLDDHDRRIAMAAGIGSGIGAIFKAPFGGALLSAEILYKRDFEADVLFPTFIASVVGFSIYGVWAGWTPIFGIGGHFTFDHPFNLVAYLLLGICAGLVGLLYPATLYRSRDIFQRWQIPRVLKPAIGGLLVGLIGLALPQALGMGYGYVQFGVNSDFTHLAGWMLVILVFVKILTTALTIGSGGSGGVFGPGMVIGGFLGGALWSLLRTVTPGLVEGMPAGAFVVVGMCGFFGGIAKAPLAVILMVAEMTGEYSLIVPAMLTTMVAYLITGDTSIYEKQVPTRLDSPAHSDDFALPLLREVRVRDIMQPIAERLTKPVLPDTVLHDVADLIDGRESCIVPVTQNGRIIGVITSRDLARASYGIRSKSATRVSQVMRRNLAYSSGDEAVYSAWVRMSRKNLRQLLVVSREHPTRLEGVLTGESIARLLRTRDNPGDSRLAGGSAIHAHSDGVRGARESAASSVSYNALARHDSLLYQRVADVMGQAPEMVPASTPLARIRDELMERRVLLVADETGKLLGIVTPADLHECSKRVTEHELTAGDVAVRRLVTAAPGDPVRAAVYRMTRMGLRQLPVIEGHTVVGLLRRRDILTAYGRELEVTESVSPAESLSSEPDS